MGFRCYKTGSTAAVKMRAVVQPLAEDLLYQTNHRIHTGLQEDLLTETSSRNTRVGIAYQFRQCRCQLQVFHFNACDRLLSGSQLENPFPQ